MTITMLNCLEISHEIDLPPITLRAAPGIICEIGVGERRRKTRKIAGQIPAVLIWRMQGTRGERTLCMRRAMPPTSAF